MFERLRANAGQLVGIQEQRRQLLPRQGFQRAFQQVFRRRVGIADAAVAVEQDHG
ncbi:hypothetical protein D3C72_2378780 [compost metagenome]